MYIVQTVACERPRMYIVQSISVAFEHCMLRARGRVVYDVHTRPHARNTHASEIDIRDLSHATVCTMYIRGPTHATRNVRTQVKSAVLASRCYSPHTHYFSVLSSMALRVSRARSYAFEMKRNRQYMYPRVLIIRTRICAT